MLAQQSQRRKRKTKSRRNSMSKNALVDLGEAIDEELAAAQRRGKKPQDRPVTWTVVPATNEITWSMPGMGELKISVQNFNMGEPTKDGLHLFAPVRAASEPSHIKLVFKHTLAEGISLFQGKAGNVTEHTSDTLPALDVPIDWYVPTNSRGNKRVAHSRVRGQDNVDFVFMNASGTFVQLQVSMVTRADSFWVAVQQIYVGQVVTTMALASADILHINHDGLNALVVPMLGYNATPPNRPYLSVFSGMGPGIVTAAINRRAYIPRGDMEIAEWEPTRIEEDLPLVMYGKKGWVKATVLFYNLVLGSGMAELEDGTLIRVHFSRILSNETGKPLHHAGHFPILHPMTQVAVIWENGAQGAQASSIVT
jgi:hypothetical protein